ncbi:MAG TPA: VanZ family protein [Caldilineae bacterium]|nr:VanZ family protein [Caldilineae bacterium]
MTRRTRWLLAALAWMLVIFWFSSQPSLPKVSDDFLDLLVKKGGHALAYGILWMLWWRATGRPWLALAFAVLYAIFDEVHQLFVPGRNGWWLDVVVDTAGALLALWFSISRRGQQVIARIGVRNAFNHDVPEQF